MKLPNGYGSVIKLGGKRRKPYAVRITAGRKKTAAGWTTEYKYLNYFETAKLAYAYLADYNAGKAVAEHKSFTDMPTFEEVYNEWLDFRLGMIKPPSASTVRNYHIAFRRFAPLHQRKFQTIRPKEIQEIASSLKEMSDSTVGMAKTVISQMYDYAIRNELVDKNYAASVVWEYTNSEDVLHIPFGENELSLLWEHCEDPFVDWILMMIYTGLRASEFIGIECRNVHLEEQYLIGGMKTEAGTNRIIPIHSAVLPFFKRYYNPSQNRLITTLNGKPMSYMNFLSKYWTPTLKRLNLDHTPHDTRHTFATLADRYGMNDLATKLIMGHSVSDLTKGVYTHKEPTELLNELEKIPCRF